MDVAGRRQLRCASRGLLNFPRYNMSSYGRRASCFTGPYVWNSLPEHIRTIKVNSCLQALNKDISTPADIAPSALETIVFYHGLCGSASPVLSATGFVSGRGQFLTPTESTPPDRSPKNLLLVITSATPTALPNLVQIRPWGTSGK